MKDSLTEIENSSPQRSDIGEMNKSSCFEIPQG